MSSTVTPYDEVPYASYPYQQTHPGRLATVARLFGLEIVPPHTSRVLELGCAAGGNLIPMAVGMPEARFVGLDLSARQIAEGQEVIRRLALPNIELRCESIADVGPELGQFDYVICHGVFSWVPAEVRKKILSICAEHLTPTGVGYISYNTYPGWHLRGTVRDMMVYHARKWSTPKERVGHARALLKFLAKAVPEEKNPYGMFLRSELELLSSKADSYLLHEHLESVNEPMYFYQFEELASQAGLQYLGEADIAVMSAEGFGSENEAIVHKIAGSIVEFEQYMDFLRNRMFRQTLVCHKNVALDRKISPDRLKGLYLSSHCSVQAGHDQLVGNQEVKFSSPQRSLTTSAPLLKLALSYLSEAWPATVPFERLVSVCQSRLYREPVDASRSQRDARTLGGGLIDCFAKRFITVHGTPSSCVATISERPRVSQLARLQAERTNVVTSLLHQIVELNDVCRHIVRLADGNHDQGQLLEALLDMAKRGELILPGQDQVTEDTTAAKATLSESLRRSLAQLSGEGLLIA